MKKEKEEKVMNTEKKRGRNAEGVRQQYSEGLSGRPPHIITLNHNFSGSQVVSSSYIHDE